MKKDEVKIGNTYRCKVTGKLADVRITGENRHGGWDAVNVLTNRKVHVKSPQRLRGLAQPRPAKRQVVKSFDDLKPDEAAKGATSAKKRPTGEPGATQRGPSGLDAAATVLAEAGGPLNTKEMVDRILAKGLWKTSGKTPAATIYAAIIREIAVKGDKSRFRKTERGKFAHTGVRRDESVK